MTRPVAALVTIGLLLVLFGVGTSLARAQDADEAALAPPSDAYCLLCHSRPDQVWELPSGETLSLSIDPAVLAQSAHGETSAEGALACADCHSDFWFPHPPAASRSVREFRRERYAACRSCHEDQYTRAQDSVHGAALREGRLEAATCVDCHGGHDVQSPDEPRQRISLTCGRCHGAIFEDYRSSVHGAALLGEDNPDVPTCIDCHGVHDIQNPTTTLFRVNSPELCAGCHANADMMNKYNVSTHVFDSYLTEFHGSTVALFDHETPNAVTNKAVCFDCHGVHNIRPVTDDGQSAIRETLLATCQQCHPDAGTSFPAAWLGHYPATAESHPALFAANGLYGILTPVILIALLIVLGSDIIRRLRRRAAGGRGE